MTNKSPKRTLPSLRETDPKPSPESEHPSDRAEATASGSGDAADPFDAHLDGLDAEDAAEAEAAEPERDPHAGLISKDQFFGGFTVCHHIPGHLFGLQSLVSGPDRAEARPASDAIYDCIADTEALRFLLEPSNLWMQRAAVILAYAVPVGASAAGEWQERKRQAAERKRKEAEAARDKGRHDATRAAAADAEVFEFEREGEGDGPA